MSDADQVIDSELLALLVCPVDHSELEVKGSQLVCTQCGRAYPIEDGIPNLVVDS